MDANNTNPQSEVPTQEVPAQETVPVVEEKSSGIGPLISIIIILIIIVAGGLYFWFRTQKDTVPSPANIEQPVEQDVLADVEADLNTEELSDVNADLNSIDLEF